MLARLIEKAGIATVTVTMMPHLASQFRLSRIIGVEFPFGHGFGMPNDRFMQRAVLDSALDILADANQPEERRDLEIEWPVDRKIAYKDWQPSEPSPIVKQRLDREAAERESAQSE